MKREYLCANCHGLIEDLETVDQDLPPCFLAVDFPGFLTAMFTTSVGAVAKCLFPCARLVRLYKHESKDAVRAVYQHRDFPVHSSARPWSVGDFEFELLESGGFLWKVSWDDERGSMSRTGKIDESLCGG